jgi:hypothetical protein
MLTTLYPNCVLWWTFFDATDLQQDFSSKNHDPTVANATYTSANGGGIDCDGADDYASTADSADFTFAGDFTIAAWVVVDATNTASRQIAYHYAPSQGWNLYTSSSFNGKFAFDVIVTSSANAIANSATVLGALYHVVGVRTSGTLNLYVNGAVQTDTGSKSGTLNAATSFWLGVDRTLTGDFDGKIFDVKLFNVALSAAQILALYNDGV